MRVFSHEVMRQREFVPVILGKSLGCYKIHTHAVNQLFIPLLCVCMCILASFSLCSCVLVVVSVCSHISADEREKLLTLKSKSME